VKQALDVVRHRSKVIAAHVSERLRHLEGRAANAVGRVGERLGADWLVYSPLRMHQFHLASRDDAENVIDSISDVFPTARTFVDVGCGSGVYAAAINAKGWLAVGCERSLFGRALARLQGVDVRPFDLALTLDEAPIHGTFDLAYCIEVAEHVPAPHGERLVEYLCQLSPQVIFTAAGPGQGGTGHVNEQPLSYWEDRFRRHGFSLDQARTRRLRDAFRAQGVQAHWLHANTAVFEQRNAR
jgi:SAM-dependent methyltransferase